MKLIYRAATLDEAESALEEFSQAWDTKYPAISRSWKNHWENLIPFFEYPEEIRRVIYTTNAIESINSVIRKAIRNMDSWMYCFIFITQPVTCELKFSHLQEVGPL